MSRLPAITDSLRAPAESIVAKCAQLDFPGRLPYRIQRPDSQRERSKIRNEAVIKHAVLGIGQLRSTLTKLDDGTSPLSLLG